MKLRYLFLLPELVLLFFFVFPIFKRICNPGNLAGILVCLFLLFVTLFPQVFAQWIRHLWGHLGGKIGLSAVCVLMAAGLVFSAVMSVQMTRAVLRHPAQPETVVVLGCKVRALVPAGCCSGGWRRRRSIWRKIRRSPASPPADRAQGKISRRDRR